MKQYTLTIANALTHTPEHPDRTAYRVGTGIGAGYTFQVWPNRPAMLKSLEMQSRRTHHYLDWHDCVPWLKRQDEKAWAKNN